jgi:ubiquinone/menaquinone biosynthesis C-methylase UbiE
MNKTLALLALPFTGERMVVSQRQEDVQMIFEHLHRYFVAAEICVARDVLDIACGEGYGANLIAQKALKVIGMDNSARAIRHARAKYRSENLKFMTGDCLKIPLPRAAVDVVISFETIEHISHHARFLQEIKRVLRPGGVLVISSPDKAEYTERLGLHNPFHVHELYRTGFLDLLRRHFANCLPMQQRLVGGSYIAADEHSQHKPLKYGTHRGDFFGGTFTEGVHEGVYCVAVCSDGPIPELRIGLFENRLNSAQMWNLFETAPQRAEEFQASQGRLRSLDDQLRQRDENISARNQVPELQMEALHNELQAARAKEAQAATRLDELNQEIVRRGEWGQALERELQAARAREAQAATKLGELNHEIVRRGEWGQELERELDSVRENLEQRDKVGVQLRLREEALQAEKKTRLELEIALQAATLAAEAGQQKALIAHDVEQRIWSERIQNTERELLKLREKVENSDLTLMHLRADVAKKHDQAVDLTARLLASELEVDRMRASQVSSTEERVAMTRKHEASRQESVARYEQQLIASQKQLASALAEIQRAMLWGKTQSEELRRERLTSAELHQQTHELRQMKVSWSWKVTAPLRRMHQLLGDPLYRRKP